MNGDGSPKGHVASAVPGRVRIKFQGDERGDAAEQAAAHLQEHPGVSVTDAQRNIGSVTVHYDRTRTGLDEILDALHDVGLMVMRHGEPPSTTPTQPYGQSSTAVGITTRLDHLDRNISQATGHRLDLKLLFPAGFFVFGLRNTLVNGLGLTTIPGYIMLWYAFDAFYKLHQEDPATPKGAQKAQAESATRMDREQHDDDADERTEEQAEANAS